MKAPKPSQQYRWQRRRDAYSGHRHARSCPRKLVGARSGIFSQLIQWRGKLKKIRCDNGPESTSAQLHSGAKEQKREVIHIQTGQPQQNDYVERDNRTVRTAWLASTLFESIEQVEEEATGWLWTDNHERRHRALGGITPTQKLALARSLSFCTMAKMGGLLRYTVREWKQAISWPSGVASGEINWRSSK